MNDPVPSVKCVFACCVHGEGAQFYQFPFSYVQGFVGPLQRSSLFAKLCSPQLTGSSLKDSQ